MSQPAEQTQIETVEGTMSPFASQNDEAEFEPLKDFENDYEIQTTYPYNIRKKKTGRIIAEGDRGQGYVQVRLNRKSYYKHRLIAKQFLENPDNLPEVDHINHDRSDYHLSNLRYVSRSTNQRNRTVSTINSIIYEYVDSISDEAIVVDEYNGHDFTDYYFHDDVFYFYNGVQYRKLHINQMKNGGLYVHMQDNEGKQVNILYSKFKKLHDLI